MKKSELERITENFCREMSGALGTLYGELNAGQQKKVLKNPAVEKMLKKYGVIS